MNKQGEIDGRAEREVMENGEKEKGGRDEGTEGGIG